MKRNAKALLSLLLALGMLLSLTACGGKTEEVEQPQETETPTMVYAADYRSVKYEGQNTYMEPLLFTGDSYYVGLNEKVGEEIPEGATLEYEGQYDVYETRLYKVSLDGSVERLTEYQSVPRAENDGNYPQFWSGTSLVAMLRDEDGTLVAVENQYTSYYDGPADQADSEMSWQNWVYTSDYYLRRLSETGAELSSERVAFDTANSYLNFYGMQPDGKGNLLCTGEGQIVAIAMDGSVAYIIPLDTYADNLTMLKDGRVAAIMDGNEGRELRILDLEKQSLSDESYALPYDCYTLIDGAGLYDGIYLSGQTVYSYSLETQDKEKLLNLMDCDVNGSLFSGLRIDKDGSIMGFANSYDGQSAPEVVTLKLVPSNTLPQKTELTMAVMDAEYNFQLNEAVMKFNRSNPTARIRMIDYSQYNTDEDYSAGQTKLLTEVVSGKLPDLLLLNNLPYRQLAAKGFLEDLYPYLDADPEIKRDDLFPNVLAAMEVNGKLCELCSSFTIETLVGASQVVGDKPGWTYSDFDAALASMPEGCDPLSQYTTRDDILRTLVSLELDELVDWTTGECRFDSEGFAELLQFASRFPKSFDWENYQWTNDEDEAVRLAEGRQMLRSVSVSYMENLLYDDAYFGGDTTYIGYPTWSGVGSMLQLGADNGLYAMSSSCKDKDAAWQFLRGFLLPKFQEGVWGLPVSRSVFNDKLEKAMTPEYRKDAEGNFVLDKEGKRIEVAKTSIGRADGSIVNVFAMTQEQADRLTELVATTTKSADNDSSIIDIVVEQAQAFFAGQKSAEEVARLIQSKVKLYVNEQR